LQKGEFCDDSGCGEGMVAVSEWIRI